MMVCVVIPVFNCEKYVEEAVKSVLKQPYNCYLEIVLIDDGSTDDSGKICDRLASQYENVNVLHFENSGVSVARNRGIEYFLEKHKNNLHSTYITFLDADDQWQENFFDQDIYHSLCCGYSLLGFLMCRGNSTLTRRCKYTPLQSGIINGGMQAVWVHAKQSFSSMFYSAIIIKDYELRFIPGLRVNEDLIFSIQALYLAKKIFLCNKILYLYRNNPKSVIHENKWGIDKYASIIEGYFIADKMMLPWENETRGAFGIGKYMAISSLIDMIAEHYQHFAPRKTIEEWCDNNSHIIALANSELIKNDTMLYNRWRNYCCNPRLFILKNIIRGAVFTVVHSTYRVAMQLKPIANAIEKARYPIPIENHIFE